MRAKRYDVGGAAGDGDDDPLDQVLLGDDVGGMKDAPLPQGQGGSFHNNLNLSPPPPPSGGGGGGGGSSGGGKGSKGGGLGSMLPMLMALKTGGVARAVPADDGERYKKLVRHVDKMARGGVAHKVPQHVWNELAQLHAKHERTHGQETVQHFDDGGSVDDFGDMFNAGDQGISYPPNDPMSNPSEMGGTLNDYAPQPTNATQFPVPDKKNDFVGPPLPQGVSDYTGLPQQPHGPLGPAPSGDPMTGGDWSNVGNDLNTARNAVGDALLPTPRPVGPQASADTPLPQSRPYGANTDTADIKPLSTMGQPQATPSAPQYRPPSNDTLSDAITRGDEDAIIRMSTADGQPVTPGGPLPQSANLPGGAQPTAYTAPQDQQYKPPAPNGGLPDLTKPLQPGFAPPLGPLAAPIEAIKKIFAPNNRATVRNNNPGGMWPGQSATQFGATGKQNLADGNQIATFDDPVNGGAAQFDLLDRRYSGMTLGAAVKKWTGSNASPSYAQSVAAKAGIGVNDPITPELLRSPQGIQLAKEMARNEAGGEFPMSDQQWQSAQAMAFGNEAHAQADTQAEDDERHDLKEVPRATPATDPNEPSRDMVTGQPRDGRRYNRDMPSNPQNPNPPYPTRQSDSQNAGQQLTRKPWSGSLIKAGASIAGNRGGIGTALAEGIGAGYDELKDQRKQLQTEEGLNQRAQGLYQQAQQHQDQYQRLTPGQIEQSQRGKWQPMGMTPDGHAVLFNGATGETKTIEAPQGMQSGKPTSVQSNANWMVQNGIAPNLPTAFNMIKSGVNDGATFSRLVQAEKNILLKSPNSAGLSNDELEQQAQQNVVQRRQVNQTQGGGAGAAPSAAPTAAPAPAPGGGGGTPVGQTRSYNNGAVKLRKVKPGPDSDKTTWERI